VETELKIQKRAIDLAVAAGRKRMSQRTGFIHFFPGEEQAADTIPLYENVCFALALFRQRSVEAVREGKDLLERLFAFQGAEGNFPVYLHEYPRCYDPWMALKIAPALFQIERHFGSVIGSDAKGKIASALDRAIRFSENRPRPPVWEHRLQKLLQREAVFTPSTQEEWFHWIVSEQLGSRPFPAEIPYQPLLQAFVGGSEIQEKGEPRPFPLEWALAESEGFSPRLLKDHPAAIQSALVFSVEGASYLPASPVSITAGRILWNGAGKLHSFSLPGANWRGSGQAFFDLPTGVEPEKGDLIEAAAFCDISPETSISVGGRKGTVFRLGEMVRIETPGLSFGLTFSLEAGQGEFCGQISRANRPAQTACRGSLLYEAFDWQIALRTLRRSGPCRISLALEGL